MEKFDGVRVFWDGKRLYCRSPEIALDVPQSCEFPPSPFEGQLRFEFHNMKC
jgi:hypothetical protein